MSTSSGVRPALDAVLAALDDPALIVQGADGIWHVGRANPAAARFVIDNRFHAEALHPHASELEDRLLQVIRTGVRQRVELGASFDGQSDATEVDISRIDDHQLLVLLRALPDAASRAQPQLIKLLAGTIETIVRVVDASEPLLVRKRFVHGLVQQLGVPGVALWVARPDRTGLTLATAAGLPAALKRAVAQPQADSPLVQAQQELTQGFERVQSILSPAPWSDHHVYLTAVPEPAQGLFGVFVEDAIPESFERMLPTLAWAYASAMRQAEVQRSNQRVVDSLVRQLRPASVDLPPKLDVGFVYRSATAGMNIGGDLYDWFLTDSGHVGLAVGDVAGKGVQAASLTALAVYSLRAFALHGGSPHLVLKMLNSAVSEQTPIERFLTLIYVRIDPVQWGLEFALGGHPPPIVMNRDGVETISLDADLPIGIEPDARFTLHRLAVEPDASLVLYTDGVTEARAPDGTLLGTDGLIEALDRLRGRPAQQVADGVWQTVEAFTAGNTSDDCAVVILHRPR